MNKISQLNYLSLFYFLLRSSFFPLLLPLLLPLENISLLSMILAILFGYFLLTIFFTVQNRFADKNILDAMEDGFGKKIGFFINSFLCFVVFLLMVIQMLHLTNFIYTEYLNETSFFVLVLLFFLSTFYVAHKGLESLCKSCFLFFILSIFLFLVKCFGVISEVDPMYLLPFKITHPFLKETFSFCTFYILPLFAGYFNPRLLPTASFAVPSMGQLSPFCITFHPYGTKTAWKGKTPFQAVDAIPIVSRWPCPRLRPKRTPCPDPQQWGQSSPSALPPPART